MDARASDRRADGPGRADAPAPLGDARRPVDATALAHVVRRLKRAPAPWLHGEVARRMAERLALLRQPPRTVLDWWPAARGGDPTLRAALRGAALTAWGETAAESARAPARGWSSARWRRGGEALPSSDHGGAATSAPDPEPGRHDLLWANMGLHWEADPTALMRRWHRALAVDGFLMFSSFGPGTLEALRALHAQVGWGPAFAPFVDMHDLGDMLVAAGFADPVMDQETLTLTWADGDAALTELRTLGGNADPARHRGLRTPRWRRSLAARLPRDADGRVALAFEVVYGHAVRVAPRPRVEAETTVGLQDMRSILRGRRER